MVSSTLQLFFFFTDEQGSGACVIGDKKQIFVYRQEGIYTNCFINNFFRCDI
jgi:Na+/H+ antiporter NhaD/arsenite permease-like protein